MVVAPAAGVMSRARTAAFAALFMVFASASTVLAASARLAWTASSGPGVVGYIVSWREASSPFVSSEDVGNVTTHTVSGLVNGGRYTFTVVAYNGDGAQSEPAEVTGVITQGLTFSGGTFSIPAGQTTTWNASAFGLDGPAEYLFRRFSPATGWVTVQNYSPTTAFAWTPTQQESGLYLFEVWARTIGSTAEFEVRVATGYSAVGDALPFLPLGGTADYDGDRRTDLGVFRPGNSTWYVLLSGRQFGASWSRTWGTTGDVPVPGDYEGDRRADFAVYRPSNSTWYVLRSDRQFSTSMQRGWGTSGDVPVPADYDGDGRTDFAVFRPTNATWYVLKSSANFGSSWTRSWGATTDLPVPADYDGDGRTDFAVFRPETATWLVLMSSSGSSISRAFGEPTDRPVPGDYDGDRRADFAVFRPSTGIWHILQSSTNFAQQLERPWGLGTDVTVPADYDGDGRHDPAVFRGSTGTWYIYRQFSRRWGMAGDIPLSSR
jgi:hypothetical protein